MRSFVPLLALVSAFAAGPALADDPTPLFGPKTYERTAGPPDAYLDTFEAPAAGFFAMWIQNGDDDDGRVAAATIRLNGVEVVGPSGFSADTEQILRPVAVAAGTNTLSVTVEGSPGSSLTLVIVPPGRRPVAVAGRLVLPYAHAGNLAIALKNGARYARHVRLLFFAPDGALVARSEKIAIPPHGSVERGVLDWIADGTWSEGSVEVIYGGRGFGRLFGNASRTDAATLVGGIEELQHAGHRVLGGPPPEAPPRRGR